MALPPRVASGPPQACSAGSGFGAAFAFTSGLFTSFSREEARRKVLAAFGAELGGGGVGCSFWPAQCQLKACVRPTLKKALKKPFSDVK